MYNKLFLLFLIQTIFGCPLIHQSLACLHVLCGRCFYVRRPFWYNPEGLVPPPVTELGICHSSNVLIAKNNINKGLKDDKIGSISHQNTTFLFSLSYFVTILESIILFPATQRCGQCWQIHVLDSQSPLFLALPADIIFWKVHFYIDILHYTTLLLLYDGYSHERIYCHSKDTDTWCIYCINHSWYFCYILTHNVTFCNIMSKNVTSFYFSKRFTDAVNIL